MEHLARGSVMRIEDGRGTLLYVWSGSLWVTQEGDCRDRYLGRGGWLRIESDGLTLISALGDSAVALTLPDTRKAEPLFARLMECWAGWFAPRARPTTAAL
jgi:hypothetical protein